MPGFGRATGGTSVVPGSTTAQEQRRVRKAQDNGTLEETVAKAASGTPGQRIATIVKASGATLPSRLTLGLAQADTPDQELRKASQLIARQLDVPPEYLLQPAGTAPLSGYVDPVTGGTISLETARRVIKPYEPKIIQSMFADYLTPQPVRMGPNGERIKAAPATTPTRLAKAFIALAPVDGKSLDFAHAASAALSLARSKGNLEVFTNNLQIALRAKGLTPLMAIKAAELGAQNGQSFGSVEDVARIVLPPEAAANIAGAEARQHNIEAVGAAGGYGGLEEQRAAAKNAAIAAAAQGNAGVQANPVHGIPVASYGVSMSAALLGALKNGEGDYNAEAAKITAEMQADHNVFKNSWVYSAVFHPLGEVIKYTSGAADVTAFVGAQLLRHTPLETAGEQVAKFAPGIGHTLAEVGSLGLYDPKQPEQHDFGTYLHNQWSVAKDLLYQRNTFGDWYTEHAGLPRWVGGPIELAVQFGLSPDAIALRALSDFRAARLISSGDTFVQNAHRFVYGPMRRFGIIPGSRANFADRLAKTLDEARTPEQAFVRQVDLTRTFFTSDGLDARTVAGMWEYAKSAKAGGASTKEIADGIRFFLGRSLGLVGEAPVGSLARYVEQYHKDLQTIADNTLPFDIAKPGGYTDAEKYAASEAERALGIVDQWDQYTMAHGPIQLEVPHGVGIPRRALSSLRANRFIGDSNTWRDVSALFNSTPGIQGGRLIINAEQNPATDLVEVMKRGRVFSQEDLAKARLEMSSAASPINATRELSIGNTVKKYEGQMLSRIEAQQGLTPKMGEEIRNLSGGMFEAQRPRMTFGAEPEVNAAGDVVGRKGVTVPLLPSQLPNTYEFIDPVWYRRGITEAMGVTRKFRNGVLRASHIGIPEAKLAHSIHGVSLTLPKAFHDTVDLLVRGLFLNIWKPLVVLRPAYVVRVVGIEEQARFLSTMGLMSRLESGKVGARIFNAVDAVRGDSRYYEYAVDRVDEAGNTIHDLFQWERRPGRLTNEALAANTNATLAFPGSDAVSRKLLDYLNARKWDTLGQDDPQFFDAWQHDLVNQAGKDPVGRIYLSGIRDNHSDETIIANAENYLNTPLGRKDATRLMGPEWDAEQLHSVLEQGVRIFRGYTPKSEIAQAALDGTLTVDDLKAVPAGSRPAFVHGPELEATLAREGPVKKLVGGIHKLILQKPTNALSRQPYFKAWYDRMVKSSLDYAVASGRTLTPELIDNIQKEARRFSLGQVNRIMFDFTRQNRLGEMVNWLIPFFQPYSEAFTVWSRILATNPQVASYVTKLYGIGKETGFIKKDPTTGEDTISLGWWADALSWATLGAVSLPDGFKASAPLNSINFFFQASLPIPTGGFAGDVPIPLPGFNPEALAILQKVVDGGQVGPWKIPDGARTRLHDYLFQYGTVTGSSLLPTWLRHTMTGLGWVGGNENELKSTTLEFLRLYQKLGLSPSKTQPLPDMSRTEFFAMTPTDRITAWKKYLSAKALNQAKHMEYFRAAGSFLFPASPRVTSPVLGAERDLRELHDKYDKTKGYQWVTDQFLSETPTGVPYVDSRRHPELSLVTIGKSIFTGGEGQLNQDVPGAGSPVPIPANPYVEQLLRTAGAKKFFQKYPEWLWAIIPSELRDAEFNQSSYFDQIGSGLRDVLSPMEFLSKDQQQQGWNNYFTYRQSWVNWQEAHPDSTEGTASYIARNAIFTQQVDQLKRDNHDWALEFGTFNTQGVDANVMAHARALVKQPTFLQTDTGAGLKEYLDLRDEIRAKMVQQNMTTITTKAAQEAGLTDQYNLGVDQIIRAHPDFKTAYDFFFGNDLQGVPTYQERILAKAPPEIRAQLDQYASQFKAAQTAIDTATDPLARSQAFIDLRNLEDQAATQFSPTYNPQMLQWKSLTPAEQDVRRSELLSKPYVFLTQFERSTILGDPTNSAAETVWEQYDATLLEIQRYQRDNPAAPVGPLYDQVNAQLATLASNNPTLATQLQHANDWTYTPRTLIKGANDPSDAAFSYWGSFLDAVHSVEVAAVKGDLHGISSGTAEQQTWWGTMQKNLESYRDQLFQQSPIFQQEYLQAEKNSPSDTLIENLMPDTFYPVGGAAFVPVTVG